MGHVADRFYADTPHTGGWRFFGPGDLGLVSDSTFPVQALDTNGIWMLSRTAGGTEHLNIRTNGLLSRLLETMSLYPSGPNYFGSPIPYPGAPPFKGSSQLTPQTTWPPKGIEITNIVTIYGPAVEDMSAAAVTLYTVVFKNITTPVQATIPLSSSALTKTALTTPTNPYVTIDAVTTPAFVTSDLTDLYVEVDITLANTGTLNFYGIGVHFNFNFD